MNTSLKLDMNNHLIIWHQMTKTLNAIPGFYLFVLVGGFGGFFRVGCPTRELHTHLETSPHR